MKKYVGKKKNVLKNLLLTVALLGIGLGVTVAFTEGFTKWGEFADSSKEESIVDDSVKDSSDTSVEPLVNVYGDAEVSFEWTSWEECTVRSEAPTRYDYRGYTDKEGLYINMVQYVDNYIADGDNVWTDTTHIEMEIWHECFGYGWSGTYLAFFPDGDYYLNNDTGVTVLSYKLTVTDYGEHSNGYRYELSYEVSISFDGSALEEPYAYVKFMSYSPNEADIGFENVTTITKDENRTLWTDFCKSYRFDSTGIVERMYS